MFLKNIVTKPTNSKQRRFSFIKIFYSLKTFFIQLINIDSANISQHVEPYINKANFSSFTFCLFRKTFNTFLPNQRWPPLWINISGQRMILISIFASKVKDIGRLYRIQILKIRLLENRLEYLIIDLSNVCIFSIYHGLALIDEHILIFL